MDLYRTVSQVLEGNMTLMAALGILAFFIAVAAAIVYLEKGERKIPVHYARRVVGQRVYGGQVPIFLLKSITSVLCQLSLRQPS